MRKRSVELLAPAGNMEAFYGAVSAGADAIYLAGNKFGARAYADNFTEDELLQCLKYAHLLHRKIYLTVNTLLKDSELKELYLYILPLYEAGLDGVIVQDFGVFCSLKEWFPDLELHASTQMTLCNESGAALLKEMGACRIVPARELSLNELKHIKESVDIEIETFIHGAMCYSYSGQCLFSSILGGRSGNRGRCAQPCRLPYAVKDKKAEQSEQGPVYCLSMKDMCTIHHIPELMEAGIDSFKIEGRMKKAEYTAGVTSIYRKYIDLYERLRETYGPKEAMCRYQVEKNDVRMLESLYIRSEIMDGYYFRNNGKEMITLTNPAYSGSDDKLINTIRDKFLKTSMKQPIRINGYFHAGEEAELCLQYEDIQVNVTGDVVAQALNRPMSKEDIGEKTAKLGDTCFQIDSMNLSVGEKVFYPLKGLNELRRMAVDQLEKEILNQNGYCFERKKNPPVSETEEKSGEQSLGNVVSISTAEQLYALSDWLDTTDCRLKRIYIPGDFIAGKKTELRNKDEEILNRLSKKADLYVSLPYIFRNRDDSYMEEICDKIEATSWLTGVLVRSLDELGYLVLRKKQIPIRTDVGFYTFNQKSTKLFSDFVEGFCIPYELNAREQRTLMKCGKDFEKILYARIPMMITANCVRKTMKECHPNQGKPLFLKDRYNKQFPVVTDCTHCTNIIYNCVPFVLLKDTEKWKDKVSLRLDFTIESPNDVIEVLDAFIGKKGLPQEYTTGHEKRGVE